MQAVLVSGCMLFVLAVLPFFVLFFGAVVGSFAVSFMPLPELVCYLSLQLQAGAVAGHVGDGTNHRHQRNARGNNTAPIGAALPLQEQNSRCVCVSDAFVDVGTVVVVLAMAFVVVVVVAAAVVVDVVLFGCESRSGAPRPCEWLQAFSVGFAVAR